MVVHTNADVKQSFFFRCPMTGWGYLSSGLNLTTSTCQANKEWSEQVVENCTRKIKTMPGSHSIPNV